MLADGLPLLRNVSSESSFDGRCLRSGRGLTLIGGPFFSGYGVLNRRLDMAGGACEFLGGEGDGSADL